MTNMLNTIRKALATFAILGIATFMLAACLGNGNGDPQPRCPEGEVRRNNMCIMPTPTRYGGWAFGSTSADGYAWALRTGDSAAAAERDAQNRCTQALGSTCERSGNFTQCEAIAVSECTTADCVAPAIASASGSTEREASRAAIARCENALDPGDPDLGTCRVDTSRSGNPGVLCVEADSPSPSPPSPPPSADRAALAFGTSERSYAWQFGTGDSAAAAERAALNGCARRLGSSCELRGRAFTNSCAAIAVSECPAGSCSTPAFGYAGGRTRREAETSAIAFCRSYASRPSVARTCRVDTSDRGNPGVFCIGVE